MPRSLFNKNFISQKMSCCQHACVYVSVCVCSFDWTEVQLCLVGLQTLTAIVGPRLWNVMVKVPAAATRLPQISFHSAASAAPPSNPNWTSTIPPPA